MLGFLFGIGLTLFVINRNRRGFRTGGRRIRRRRREWMLDRLSAWLDTTPSQDRVLEEVVDDLMDVMVEERAVFTSSRSTIADALKAETWDPASLDGARSEQEESLGRVHDAAKASLGKLHAVLDEDQRAALANFLAHRGHRGRRNCGRRRHLHAA